VRFAVKVVLVVSTQWRCSVSIGFVQWCSREDTRGERKKRRGRRNAKKEGFTWGSSALAFSLVHS
jgi:hypothetical protein